MTDDVLNLDALKPKPIKVVIGGETIEIAAPGIGQVLDVVQLEERVAAATGVEQVRLMIEQLSILVGDDCVGVLEGLTSEQLTALREHISERLGFTAKKAKTPRRRKKKR